MQTILYILLVVVTHTHLDIHGFTSSVPCTGWVVPCRELTPPDSDVTDEWGTMQQSGDGIFPATGYYKAVLFASRAALDRYLAAHQLGPNTILLDVQAGKQYRLAQTPVTETVTKEETVTKGYATEWQEKTP